MRTFVDPQPSLLGREQKTPESHPEADTPFAERYPLRILIAEDNYINRRVLLMVLQRLGYEVEGVENGRECLETALEDAYDLILTDVNMPEMDGIECTRLLRSAGIQVPVVALTANPHHIQEECLRAGMNGFLAKPVTIGQIEIVLRETFLKKNSPPPAI